MGGDVVRAVALAVVGVVLLGFAAIGAGVLWMLLA